MKVFPCAKINLGLYVTERRSDGYHNLETVFYPIPLCDELEAIEADSDELHIKGIPVLGAIEDNLVMRALNQLRKAGCGIPPLHIRLTKNIPSGAGLGGGSSDAAFMMVLAREMFHLPISDQELRELLTPLGADCPFFVSHQPVFATGIGDQFTPIDLRLTGLWLVLVKPNDFVSTREAYQGVTPRRPQYDLLKSIRRPIAEWQQFIANNFENSVFPQHPTIAAIKQGLLSAGAVYAAMSGSGSAVYGLFQQEPSAEVLKQFDEHFVFSSQL